MLEHIARRNFLRTLGTVSASLAIRHSGGYSANAPVVNPALQKSLRDYKRLGYKRVFIDFHIPDYKNNIPANIDGKAIVDTVLESGVDTLIFPAKSRKGYYYYDIDSGYKHSALKTNLFGEILSEAQKVNLAVTAYFPVGEDEYLRQKHPEWHLIHDNDKQQDDNRYTGLCINSEYGEKTIEDVKELCSKYSFSALFLDMFPYSAGADPVPCYCRACKDLWEKKQYGYSILDMLQRKNHALHLDFRNEYLNDFLKSVKKTVKKISPSLIISHNIETDFGSADYIQKEGDSQGKNYFLLSFMCKYARSQTRNSEFEISLSRSHRPGDFSIKPIELMRWEASSVISHNGAVNIIDQPHIDGSLETKAWKTIRKVNKTIDSISPHLFGTRPFAEAAVLYSRRNRELQRNTAQENGDDIAGAYKFLVEEHYPCSVLTEEDMTLKSLSRLKLIIIPDTVFMNPEKIRILKHWCRLGGILLFDYRTAMLDDYACPLDEPGFGMVSVTEENPSAFSFIKPNFDIESPYLSITENVYIKPVAYSYPLGFLVRAVFDETDNPRGCHALQPGVNTRLPAIILAPYNEGRFIYFTSRIFKELLISDARSYRQLIKTVIEQAYTPCLTLEAPRTVEMIPYGTANGYRIFLINRITGPPSGSFNPLDSASPSRFISIDTVIPVHNIKIHLEQKAKAARDQHGNYLKITVRETSWIITVPKVEQYEIVDIIC